MAGGDVTYRLVVNSSGAVKSLQTMDQAFNRANTSARRMGRTISENNNRLGMQERSANLAGAAALELSRVASDAAYGIRGMANNIGQLITMFSMMVASTDAATGATLGFAGAMKALWRAITGPLGVVIAIQGLLSLWTLWDAKTTKLESRQKKLKKQTDKLSKSISEKDRELRSLLIALENVTEGTDIYYSMLDKIKGRVPEVTKLLEDQKATIENITAAIRRQMRAESDLSKIQQLAFDTPIMKDKAEALKDEREEIKGMVDAIETLNNSMDNSEKKRARTFIEANKAILKDMSRNEFAAYAKNRIDQINKEVSGYEDAIRGNNEYMQTLIDNYDAFIEKTKDEDDGTDIIDRMFPTNSDIDERLEAVYSALETGANTAEQQINKLADMGLSKLQQKQLGEIRALKKTYEEAALAMGDEPEAKQEAKMLYDQYLEAIGAMRKRHSIERHQDEMQQVQANNEQLEKIDKEKRDRELAAERQHQERLAALRRQAMFDAIDMMRAYQMASNDLNLVRLENEHNALLRNAKTKEEFDQLQLEKDRAMFETHKKAQISEAYINMAAGVVDIWAKYGYAPPIAAGLTAAHLAVSMKQIQAIKSQQFAGDISPPGGLGASAGGSLPEAQETGFSNLQGGENPYQAIRVNVLEHDVRTTQDKVKTLKVRSRL